MQYDMERFDKPLLDETQPKAHVWTDIGEAEVAHSIFGKAKVRVNRKQDEIRGAIRWTLVTIALVVGAVWLIDDVSRQPEIVYVAPPEPVAEVARPKPQKPVPVAVQIKPRVPPAIVESKPVPQLAASSAPAVVSGVSAPALAKPVPLATKPAAMAAPIAVTVKPVAPATPATSAGPVTAKPAESKTPAAASSAVMVTD